MARPYLGNPKYTIEVLQKYHFVFQKRFGQNFLIDEHVLEKIIDSSGITKDDFILEIGPGIGTMTQYLAEAAREVAAVEIDSSLIPILKALRIGIRELSISTAATSLAASARYCVMVPIPGPISSIKSSFVIPEESMIFSRTCSSIRKF